MVRLYKLSRRVNFHHLLLFLLVSVVAGAEDFRDALVGECAVAKDCFCDRQCEDASDCCPSISPMGTKTPQPDSELPRYVQGCLPSENTFSQDSIEPSGIAVLAVNRCPPSQAVPQDILSACEASDLLSANAIQTDKFLWLKKNIRTLAPVVSVHDRAIFANVDCAICNGVFGEQHFNRRVALSDIQKGLILYPLRIGCYEMDNKTTCRVGWNLPPSLHRPCGKGRSRMFFRPPGSFMSIDDLFILPGDYLNNDFITLPFEDNSTNSTEASGEPSGSQVDYYIWLQMALLAFSIAGLSLMLVVYGANTNLRKSLAGRLTVGLGVSLLLMEAIFLLVSLAVPAVEGRRFCVTMATALLFSLLSSFMWMALLGFQLLLTFGNCRGCLHLVFSWMRCTCCHEDHRRPTSTYTSGFHQTSTKRRFRKSLAAAILVPFIIVLPAIVVNEYSHNLYVSVFANMTSNTNGAVNITTTEVFGQYLSIANPGFCPVAPGPQRAWFSNIGGLVIWFLVPAASMISFNAIALFIVCIQIYRLSRETRLQSSPQNEQEKIRRDNSKSLVSICAKLAIILGASWFIQFFAGWWPELVVLRRLAGLANSAQGGVIALSMLLSVKARRAVSNWLPQSCRRFLVPGPITETSGHSKNREKSPSFSSRTWTSVLLPKKNRPSVEQEHVASDDNH